MKQLKSSLICVAILICSHTHTFAHGLTYSAGGATECVDSDMLYALRLQMADIHPIYKAGFRDCFLLTLGYQDRSKNELHFGFCLANMSWEPIDTVGRPIHNFEILNYKSNYGLHDVKLGLLGYEYGNSVGLFQYSESGQLGQTDLSKHTITDSYCVGLFYALGFAAEYDQLEKPVKRDQKWYIGPTVSLGFSSYLAYLNVYARLRCGVNKSSLVSEAVIPFNWRKEICMRVFFNADYYYSLQSARDNTFLKSFGVGLAFKI